VKQVYNSVHQGRFRANESQIGANTLGQFQWLGIRETLGYPRDTWIAGRSKQADPGALGQFPGERVLAATPAYNHDVQCVAPI
jgi:hypothetical protein